MVLGISVIYPCDPMTYWEQQLTATAQHHKRGLYHVSLAQEKNQIQNSKYNFYWMPIAFSPSESQKIVNGTTVNWGPSVLL